MFKDEAKIYVKAGDGGDGCISFRREKYIPRGGPDGGDGGNGGDIVICARNNVSTLLDLVRKRSYIAKNGAPGGGKNRTGKSGAKLLIKVPVGTLIKDDEGNLLADLKEHGSEIVVARGGHGGRGNTHFATATNQVPREAEPGQEGEEKNLQLDLKLIADVGLVGFPNAGKSTLLSRISAARPKIANYPFTTLEPQLGIVDLADYKQLVVADLPGIIEGAHEGVGLGYRFLRHIERTRLLLYMIDMNPDETRKPWEIFAILQRELRSYSEILAERPFLIAANKMDLTGSEELLEEFRSKIEAEILAISAVTGKGLPQLLQKMVQMLEAMDGG